MDIRIIINNVFFFSVLHSAEFSSFCFSLSASIFLISLSLVD